MIEQGSFVSDGAETALEMRQGCDWMTVYNYTTLAAGGAATVVKSEWQRGMADGEGIFWLKLAADDSLEIDAYAANGFTYQDTSSTAAGLLNATITTIDNAAPPLVSLADTTGLADGDVVRILDVTGAQQLGAIDFTIDNLVANTEFELVWMNQIVTTGVIVAGQLRKVNFDPIYYPRARTIANITQAAQAVVTTTVTNLMDIGEKVRFRVDEYLDMVEMDGLIGTIVDTDAANNTITVDIDSTAFTAFDWPVTADDVFTPAQVVPIGESTHVDYANQLDGATENVAEYRMLLGGGNDSPAGIANDVIYWKAGVSIIVNN